MAGYFADCLSHASKPLASILEVLMLVDGQVSVRTPRILPRCEDWNITGLQLSRQDSRKVPPFAHVQEGQLSTTAA